MWAEGTNGKGTVKIDKIEGSTSASGGVIGIEPSGRKTISCWVDNSYSTPTSGYYVGELFMHPNQSMYCLVKNSTDGTTQKSASVRVWYAYIDV